MKERIHRPGTPNRPTQQGSSPVAPRPFAAQAQPEPQRPLPGTETASNSLGQQAAQAAHTIASAPIREPGQPTPLIKNRLTGGAILQRTEGELTRDYGQLKVGTKVKVLSDLGLRFRVQDVATSKTYWITGELKDYFKAGAADDDVGVAAPVAKVEEQAKVEGQAKGGSVSAPKDKPKGAVAEKVMVLRKEPAPEKVVEDVSAPRVQKPASVAKGKQKASGPSLVERLKLGQYPPMGRIDDPSWDKIEPLLDDYGVTVEEKTKLKRTFDRMQESGVKIRGIPDLIDMTFRGKSLEKTATHVKKGLAAAAPDLETWKAKGNKTVTCGRADTRMPHEIEDNGGFFGWDAGVVTGSHARSMIKTIMVMSEAEQNTWINKWKYPTPDKSEANPWVASGIGALGGQKGGGEFIYELPLIYLEAEGNEMVVATDTGDVENASVIGVRLGKSGDEIVMLTGIPWKYMTGWYGSTGMGATPKMYKPDEAAAITRKQKKA